MVPEDSGAVLLPLARAAIAGRLGLEAPVVPAPGWLDEPGACFVTLQLERRLRGCIGTIEPYRPLGEDTAENARAAAFHDPRFPPLTAAEFPVVELEVSVLSPLEPLAICGESDLLAQLRPGQDGVLLSAGSRRGTFLPQVWEQLPDPRQFLAHLKAKAGLPARAWSPDWQFFRYQVHSWRETPA